MLNMDILDDENSSIFKETIENKKNILIKDVKLL